jgi:2-oxoglutarate dehydrogenase E1 component
MDEPAFTQPLLYKAIRNRKGVREGYLEHLLRLGDITAEQAEQIREAFVADLESGLSMARNEKSAPSEMKATGVWEDYSGGPEPLDETVNTGVEESELANLLKRTLELPEGFHRHPRLEKLAERRAEMAEGAHPLDWSVAETLALASLAQDGVRIRLSGQDSARGTFSQRHAVLHDCEDGAPYLPLGNLSPDPGAVEVINSPLSEAGVLGFEYGYSLDCPDGLVMWEAQYGDFVNAAQVIIDQFIVSAEAKWQRLSGLVLLLPHGFEGQGPEHSSARMERFLMLAAKDNIQIAQPSTPAQYFHLLRRQALRRWRKPLVVFTPKSLLRHAGAISSLDELARGAFRRVIPDEFTEPSEVRRILLCSGKVYYFLAEHRARLEASHVAIARLEQLYPLGEEHLNAALGEYTEGTPAVWVQEEPANMGPWPHLRLRFGARLLNRFPLTGICRPESASPATGSAAVHKREQALILEAAFDQHPATGA